MTGMDVEKLFGKGESRAMENVHLSAAVKPSQKIMGEEQDEDKCALVILADILIDKKSAALPSCVTEAGRQEG